MQSEAWTSSHEWILKEESRWTTVQYLPVDQQVPCFATKNVPDGDLDQVKWHIENQAVQPYDTGPAPSDRTDRCEADGRIDGDKGSHLRSRASVTTYRHIFNASWVEREWQALAKFWCSSLFSRDFRDSPVVLRQRHKSAELQAFRGMTGHDCVWRRSEPGWWCWPAGTSPTRPSQRLPWEISPWNVTAIQRQIFSQLIYQIYLQFWMLQPMLCYLKECGPCHCPVEQHRHQSKVGSHDDSSCKDLIQLPPIWSWRRLHAILWYRHDGPLSEWYISNPSSWCSNVQLFWMRWQIQRCITVVQYGYD